MHFRSSVAVLLSIFSLVACSAANDAPSIADGELRTGDYTLRAQDFDVADPPRSGSPEEEREIEVVRRHQATRRWEDCRFAESVMGTMFDDFFKDTLDVAERREFRRLMDTVMIETEENIVGVLKRRYHRRYPFTIPGIDACPDEDVGDGAYPSGHAAVAVVAACVLAKGLPEKATELNDHAQHIADNRVVIGRHFPSDVAAGKKLGRDICAALFRDREFKEAFEAGDMPRASSRVDDLIPDSSSVANL